MSQGAELGGEGEPPAKPWFPGLDDLARINQLVQLLDHQRREHGTPPTELTTVDPAPLLKIGFKPHEIDAAIRDQRMWETLALERYGRIGRDPARIRPFLDRFAQRWGTYPTRRFGELLYQVSAWRFGDLGLLRLDEEGVEKTFMAWEKAGPKRKRANEGRWRREKKDIASVLMPLHDVWVGDRSALRADGR
jgi:hypothetical protein